MSKNQYMTKIAATILASGTALLFMAGPTHAMQVVDSAALDAYVPIEIDDLFDSSASCSACHLACGYACRAPGIYCGFSSDCDSGEEKCLCKCISCTAEIL